MEHDLKYNFGYDALLNFIRPIRIEIPIEKNFTYYHIEYENYIKNNIKNEIDKIIPNEYIDIKNKLIDNICICYSPSKSGYIFRYSPIYIINNLFHILGYFDKDIKYFNLDNKEEVILFKELLKKRLGYILFDIDEIENKINNKSIKSNEDINTINYFKNTVKPIISIMWSSINDIINIKDIDVSSVKDILLSKDVAFYVAFKSLKLLNETGNSIYSIFPKEYYYEVQSKYPFGPQYPHKVNLDGKYYWKDDFNNLYINTNKMLFRDKDEFNLDYAEYESDFEIVEPGSRLKEESDAKKYALRVSHECDPKWIKLFNEKLEFFENSGSVAMLKGLSGARGYRLYCYPNDNILMDKIYGSEGRGTILTHSEAAYGFPADRYDLARENKQVVMYENRKDSRVVKIYHDQNKKYLDKFHKVISAKSNSKINIHDLIERELKTKSLTRSLN